MGWYTPLPLSSLITLRSFLVQLQCFHAQMGIQINYVGENCIRTIYSFYNDYFLLNE